MDDQLYASPHASDIEDDSASDASGEEHNQVKHTPNTPPDGVQLPSPASTRPVASNPVSEGQQRGYDPRVIRKRIDQCISNIGTKARVWTAEDWWAFLKGQYEEHMTDREREKGSWRTECSKEYAFGGLDMDMQWLRETYKDRLLSWGLKSASIDSQVKRSFSGDEGDEELAIKKKNNQDREPCASIKQDIDQIGRAEHVISEKSRTTSRHDSVPVSRQHGSNSDSNDNEYSKPITPNIVFPGSTIISETVGLEWRQSWRVNERGKAVLITPRIWKWNRECELVEWPSLDQILPPLEPRPEMLAASAEVQGKRKCDDGTLTASLRAETDAKEVRMAA